MKEKLKRNYKLIIGIVIGVIVSFGSTYATTVISSSDISYDNSTSGLKDSNNQKVTDMQTAIDVLYTKANQPKGKNNTVYFAVGDPTTSSTTDYTTLGINVFVALNGIQKSVCIIRNNRLHCFDNNNYAIEKEHAQQVFSDVSCSVSSSDVTCFASEYFCGVNSSGYVSCSDFTNKKRCDLGSDGDVSCYQLG